MKAGKQEKRTKRVDTGPPRLPFCNGWPRRRLLGHTQMLAERLDARAELFEQHVRWHYTLLHSQTALEQACNTSSALCVADDRLDRPHIQVLHVLRRVGEKGLRYGLGFLRIACRCPGSCFSVSILHAERTQKEQGFTPCASKNCGRPSGLLRSSPARAYVARISAACATLLGIVMPAVLPSWPTPVSRIRHSIVSLSARAWERVLSTTHATPSCEDHHVSVSCFSFATKEPATHSPCISVRRSIPHA